MLGKDLDTLILLELNDEDLGKICSTSLHFRNICKDENFWRQRTIKRFGKYLGEIEKIKIYKEQMFLISSKNNTWIEYYKYLVVHIKEMYKRGEQYYFDLKNDGSKSDEKKWRKYFKSNYVFPKYSPSTLEHIEDLKILEKIFYTNTEKLRDGNNNWKDLIKLELINPNELLGGVEKLEYLINSGDTRIDLSYKNNIALSNTVWEEEINQELVNLILKDKKVDPNIALPILLSGKKIENILTDPRITKDGLKGSVFKAVYEYQLEVDEKMMKVFMWIILREGGSEDLKDVLRDLETDLEEDDFLFHKPIEIIKKYLGSYEEFNNKYFEKDM